MDRLKIKYRLQKADHSPVDEDGVYFVLKPNSKDALHAKASQAALKCYASAMKSANPEFAAELIQLVDGCREFKAGNVVPLQQLGFVRKP